MGVDNKKSVFFEEIPRFLCSYLEKIDFCYCLIFGS